jgi:hypothetical protein
MKRFQFSRVLPCFLLLGLRSSNALADGGVVRLRQAQGPFIVTIFTASEPVLGSLVDVSVMVQKRDSSDAILDAGVDLVLKPPGGLAGGPMEPLCGLSEGPGQGPAAAVASIRATREQASDKLLYAAPVYFGTAGNWRLKALVKRGREVVEVAFELPVGSRPPRLAGLFPYLAIPAFLVALFAMNQHLRNSFRWRNSEKQQQ